MDFTTLNLETSSNSKNSVCRIAVTDYHNNEIINKKEWLLQPPKNDYAKNYSLYTTASPKDTIDKPNIYDVWEEIENRLNNKMVISYHANYNIDCLISSFNYFMYKNQKEKSNNEIKNSVLRFEFICLSLILRRLFENLDTNFLNELCQKVIGSKKINLGSNNGLKIGFLFKEVLRCININDFIELKHLSGITIGQVHTYKIFKKLKVKTLLKQIQRDPDIHFDELTSSSFDDIINTLIQNKDVSKIYMEMEYPQSYYPCLPITNTNDFRKYDFTDLIRRFQYD